MKTEAPPTNGPNTVRRFEHAPMKFAGFWQRFCAGCIDFFVLLLPLIALGWLGSLSYAAAIICAVPCGLLFWYYTFHFHAATGQTIGKRTLGIRVVRLDGSRIGRSDAFRRSAVYLLFAVISITGILCGLLALSSAEFTTSDWLHQQQLVQQSRPSFIRWADIAVQIWVWGEVFTMLFNRQKRAIHDFIAGTVVINENA